MKVEKWIKKAEKDLDDAEFNFGGGRFEVAAFLAHQAAEKALKALYKKRFKRLLKIHDLQKLSAELKAGKRIVETCRELNPHYLATRYPLEIEYDVKRAKAALENSKRVLGWVKKKFGK